MDVNQYARQNIIEYQFGIYWTRLNVNTALSSSNGNVCIALSIQNIDYKKWEKMHKHCTYEWIDKPNLVYGKKKTIVSACESLTL
jgi:hypothetical protein